MHKEVLTEEQLKFLPMLKSFSGGFGLVGGTAMALHIGHRRSIDFDLFTDKSFNNLSVQKKVKSFAKIENILVKGLEELTFVAPELQSVFSSMVKLFLFFYCSN